MYPPFPARSTLERGMSPRRGTAFALAALAFALSGVGTAAYADSDGGVPVYLPGVSEWQERQERAMAAFYAELCGPPAIRRRADCPSPDEWDAETYEQAYERAIWALTKTLFGGENDD